MKHLVGHLAPALLAASTLTAMAATPVGAQVAASAEEIQPLLIGAEVPDVELHTLDGEAVHLAEKVKSQQTILIFFRGGW